MAIVKKPGKGVGVSLKNGGICVLPTDTIYGIVGSALNKRTVGRIYRLRKRNPKKPMIILISSPRDLRLFGVSNTQATQKYLKKVWPGKVSVILRTMNHEPIAKFGYLHRGTKMLAFRFPKPTWLRKLLRETGPLVAPSANWEGKPPAKTIREAKKYFGKQVDFYVDAGRVDSSPSKIVKIENGKVVVLRP